RCSAFPVDSGAVAPRVLNGYQSILLVFEALACEPRERVDGSRVLPMAVEFVQFAAIAGSYPTGTSRVTWQRSRDAANAAVQGVQHPEAAVRMHRCRAWADERRAESRAAVAAGRTTVVLFARARDGVDVPRA